MGYPENAEAIPDLVNSLHYRGSFPPAEAVVMDTLRAIGAPILPHVRAALLEHADDDLWVGALACVLQDVEAARLVDLSDVFVRTLQTGLKHDHEEYTGVMSLLERIGSPKADGAIPTLCTYYVQNLREPPKDDELTREAQRDVRRAAITCLAGLKPSSLACAVPTIESAVCDPDEVIRTTSRRVLARLRASSQ